MKMDENYDEEYIEKKLIDKVKSLGGRAYKFISPGNAGVPDRLVVLPGGKVRFCRDEKKKRRKSIKTSGKTN